MMAQAELMVVVSHDLESLKQFCDQAVWMDRGRQSALQGPIKEVIAAYTASVQGPPAGAKKKAAPLAAASLSQVG